ncbi:hypothetical protein D8B26_006223 [Coccidioides posadasii str. Silveira]|uniref:Uncharacterized protein n=2 Tax=Coccidioides posadasii TaxID=199306 RepID=E9DB96_COCPS|nr:hypothetical protein CPC735_030170 [Coccidioides posadasii C735 delta SOWgp]EER27681.1 hypothetical protein CPC735_030170 [Coccidioides posadasii C735 delta SOWgp]EFW16048.1 conserved hypothetical protein [Coccidioides posadasii str. Silveira]QVM11576.1 hypothetical protein D8B26_006223 [Coccidioides posadasii str. Silveira]|eukprot:XP_003069826.1 hypothetical protein CPC735_030170 [Coccidioides posadasii C735 delta SOWgp]
MAELPPSSFPSTATPIASLSPTIQDVKEQYVRAVVILLWPFSSSSKQCSLLLSEPDFRLRGLKGQVKAVFHNGAASAVAESKIAIGDIVRLSLDGVKWKSTDNGNSDLTRELGWDLEFDNRVLLEIHRDSKPLGTVDFKYLTNEVAGEVLQGVLAVTPAVRPRSPSASNAIPNVWSSPAFAQSLTSSMIANTAEEDGFILGRGRKRTKFGRLSSEWTYLDSPPSPIEVDAAIWQDGLLEDQSDRGDVSIASSSPNMADELPNLAHPHLETPRQPIESPELPVSADEINGLKEEPEVSHIEQTARMPYILESSPIPTGCLSPSIRRTLESNPEAESPGVPPTLENAGKDEVYNPSDIDVSDDMMTGLQKRTEPTPEITQPPPTALQGIPTSPIISSPSPHETKEPMEGSANSEAESEYSLPATSEEMEDFVENQSRGTEDSEIGAEGSEAEATSESVPEPHGLKPAQAHDWEYSESEVPCEESQSPVSCASAIDEHGLPSSGDSEEYEIQGDSFSRTPYSQEVIILDSDEEEAGAGRLITSQRSDSSQHEIEVEPEESNVSGSLSAGIESETCRRAVISLSDDTEQVAESSSFIGSQGIYRQNLSSFSTRETMGGHGEVPAPPVEREIRPRPESSMVLESHTFPIDPSLLLDGTGHGSIAIEPPLHGNHRPITPSNTQESRISFYELQMPSMHAVHPLPTPEFSQEGPVSRPSLSESLYATETEPTFNSVLEGSFEVSRPPVMHLQEEALPHRSQFDEVGASAPAADSMVSRHEASTEEREVEISSKASTQFHTPEPTVEVSSPVLEIPREREGLPGSHVAGLRTKLSYFCPLSLLVGNFNQSVDTISVVISASPLSRAGRRPRDHFITLHITDSSLAGDVICAQIFCKTKALLPTCTEGDVILLRNCKVQSIDHKMMLNSMDDSSWAVFVQGAAENVQVNGPPVEFDEEERNHVTGLRQWYMDSGGALVAKKGARSREGGSVETSSSIAPSESGSVSSRGRGNIFKKYRRKRKSTPRRITVHELRGGRRYLDVGSPSDKESIHELRDGTVYAHL